MNEITNVMQDYIFKLKEQLNYSYSSNFSIIQQDNEFLFYFKYNQESIQFTMLIDDVTKKPELLQENN